MGVGGVGFIDEERATEVAKEGEMGSGHPSICH